MKLFRYWNVYILCNHFYNFYSANIIDFIADIEKGSYYAGHGMDDWVRDNIAINYPLLQKKLAV